MKKILLFLIGLVIIFLQTFVINYFSRFVSVNILLVYIIIISLYIDKDYALIISGTLGLLEGMISGGIIGLDGILFLAVAYFISVVEKYIFKDNKWIISFLILVVSFIYSILSAVIAAIFFSPQPLLIIPIKVLAICIYNVLIGYIGFHIFEDYIKKLREKE